MNTSCVKVFAIIVMCSAWPQAQAMRSFKVMTGLRKINYSKFKKNELKEALKLGIVYYASPEEKIDKYDGSLEAIASKNHQLDDFLKDFSYKENNVIEKIFDEYNSVLTEITRKVVASMPQRSYGAEFIYKLARNQESARMMSQKAGEHFLAMNPVDLAAIIKYSNVYFETSLMQDAIKHIHKLKPEFFQQFSPCSNLGKILNKAAANNITNMSLSALESLCKHNKSDSFFYVTPTYFDTEALTNLQQAAQANKDTISPYVYSQIMSWSPDKKNLEFQYYA